MSEVTDKLITESTICSIETALEKCKEDCTLSSSPEIKILEQDFAKMKEDISGADWGRMGVIFGLLWYKLDTIIQHLSSIASSTQSVERNTAKLK